MLAQWCRPCLLCELGASFIIAYSTPACRYFLKGLGLRCSVGSEHNGLPHPCSQVFPCGFRVGGGHRHHRSTAPPARRYLPGGLIINTTLLAGTSLRFRGLGGCTPRCVGHHHHCSTAPPARRYFPGGFIINTTQVEGALLCLPDTWLMWDVTSLGDVTTDSLAILDVVAPAPEVLVLGCGSTMQRLPADVMDYLAARGVAVELIDTVSSLLCCAGSVAGMLALGAGAGLWQHDAAAAG